MATVYEYKGASYELPDGLSNEAALAKIKASLGEAQPSAQPTTQQLCATVLILRYCYFVE